MPELRTEEVSGWTLTFGDDGRYTRAVDIFGNVYELGQKVVANGRFGAPAGTVGAITHIYQPWSDERNNDFLQVTFPRYGRVNMKTKDLER